MTHLMLAALIIYFGVGLVGWSLTGSQPVVSTTVSAAVTASDVTVPAGSAEGFASSGWIFIRGEALEYSANETPCVTGTFSGQPACFTGVERGQLESVAIAHPSSSRIYNELTGTANDLATFETRTSVNDLGNVTTPWGSGLAIARFFAQNATWDWPMFDGNFAIFRAFGALFTISMMLGGFYLLATLGVSAIRTLRP